VVKMPFCWVQTRMRASLDQIRDPTIDAVDAVRGRASELVTMGAERLVGTIEKGADGLEGRIDQLADRAPALSLEVDHRRRRRWPVLVSAVAVIIAGLAIARRRRTKVDRDQVVRSPQAPLQFEVVPSEDRGWNVVSSESRGAASHHDTQAQGIEHATHLAKAAGGGEVVIHGLDGHPRETRSITAATG
jgi:Uncharacterized protein conserved in bacteria (DUF2188)